MSTNYYAITKDKSLLNKYDLNYKLTDEPDWGYRIHICQTSFDVVPLYQAHPGIQNLETMKQFIQEPNIQLYNEYLEEITPHWLIEHVFNVNKTSNPNLHSREELSNKFSFYFFKDEQGNEFCNNEFE